MPEPKRTAWLWIAVLAAIRLLIHILVADQYGFHRDEYLYLAQTEHLAWGFMEVPPVIAAFGAFIRIFGDGIVWIKFWPALFGTGMVFLLAKMTSDLGGQRWAQLAAVLAFMFVPAFLRTQHLFQPVFLSQFIWTLLTFLIIRLQLTKNKNYWYAIGVAIGIGMLTKYTMAFVAVGLIAGLLLTPSRNWLRTREPWIAAAIALLIFAPNLFWQYDHNWPVINHMRELRERQLVNVQPTFFIGMQFLMLFTATLLWVPGVVSFFGRRLKQFRLIGWMYLVLIFLLLVLSGKPYYSLGIYPVLIAAGAVWWEHVLKKGSVWRFVLPSIVVMASLPLVPYGIPVLSIENMKGYCVWMRDNVGLSAPLVWEDGVEHEIPQDYADMFGWEEAVSNLAKHYHQLTESEQADCNLWGGNYGHAGAILYYADKYDLPADVTSFNGSFALWAEDEADFSRQLNLDDQLKLGTEYFANVTVLDSTSNSYARDPGYIIYRSDPVVDIPTVWRQLVSGEKGQWQRHKPQ